MSSSTYRSPEMRYGCPEADLVLHNRYFSVGYSYYFRQAKWALEIVDPDKKDLDEVSRLNNFRPDFRVPKRFRADLSDYAGSGYDRGHLVSSANQNDENIQNSETFLLSNMSPQIAGLNRQKWKQLESAVRKLDEKKAVLETYVISGPIFDFTKAISFIGENDENGIKIPIPSHFYKCILAEYLTGKLEMWAFELPNLHVRSALKSFAVSTSYIEQRTGMQMWNLLTGPEMELKKLKTKPIWSY